jgi:hypothetical protein
MDVQYLRPIVILTCFFLSACASVVRDPLPEEFHDQVTVLGRNDLRQWGDGVHPEIFAGIQDHQDLEDQFGGIMHREHHYLVISGGGARGAYGAGVLTAWSELGTRPEFTIVTGVSTGALTAPFAFLGSDYDEQLETVYTTLDTRQIFDTRRLLAKIGGDSLVDTSPLSRMIEEVVDNQMIEAIAREHHSGRVLSVATTNLDAGRPVMWNITRIAASGHPEAARLVRQVLLASASIPGAFPPVYIEVEAPDGNRYDEMHVDGGASSQMYLYPAGIDWGGVMELFDVKGMPQIHLIRNAFLRPEYEIIEPRLLPIIRRTVSSLIRTQGIGDLFRIGALADRDGLNLYVTWIPEEAREQVNVEPSEAFDPNYMKALFEFAHSRTLQGETWKNFSELVESVEPVEIPD